jgi:S1-C subfamily serine protease
MSRLMFVYLSGTEKGKTRIFTQSHVTIGTWDACDLKLVPEEGGLLPEGRLADIYDDEGVYHLVTHTDSLEIRINGEEIEAEEAAAGYALQDGDTIDFGRGLSSASLLFQVMPENFSASQIVRRNARAIEQAQPQPVHPLTATLFVKELTASLWAEIPRRVKLIGLVTIGVVTLAIIGFIYTAIVIVHRNSVQNELIRKQIEEEQAKRREDQATIRKLQEQIEKQRRDEEQSRLFTQQIVEQYSAGVCLIVGSYSFVERGTGRLLRYEAADDDGNSPVDQNGNLLASVDGAGPPVRIDYTGTGFVINVNADGSEAVIVTNKHVARPWVTDQIAQIILQQGAGLRPRLDTLDAFFPSIKTPFPLKEIGSSSRFDVSLCRFDPGNAALPKLPMNTDEPTIASPVVLMGYPTGVDGLLQRIETSEQNEIIRRSQSQTTEGVAKALAERGLIRPLTTTGTISDAPPGGRIVHSAQTTEGGSGSPLFDRSGQVIAVNSAILTTADGKESFGGSNFGVPIKVVYDMFLAYLRGELKPE